MKERHTILKHNTIWCLILTLFFSFAASAQEVVCPGETILLQGWSTEITCDCNVTDPIGPVDCFPFIQPGGQWTANGEVICTNCIDIEVSPTEDTYYEHSTPGYTCGFVIGPGPQPPLQSYPPGPYYQVTVAIDPDCGGGPEPPAPDCSLNTGTIFFDDCNGQQFFFILTDQGEIFDPYYGPEVTFNHYDGQEVNFDYEPAGFATECVLADEAIIINCIEEVSGPIYGDELLDSYPWLLDIVDPINCNALGVFEFDQGSYSYLYVEYANGGELFLNNGTFYCSDSPGFSCLDAYGLSMGEASLEWICGDITDPTDPSDPSDPSDPTEPTDPETIHDLVAEFPWISSLVDLNDCTDTSISEFDEGNYSFIYILTEDAGTLYYQDGTLYCTDAPGFGCIVAYDLNFESFNYQCPDGGGGGGGGHTICPGEESIIHVPYQVGTIIGPPCPQGPIGNPIPPVCDCQKIVDVSISPGTGVISADPAEGMFIVSPETSTIYTITVQFGPQHTEDFCLGNTTSLNVEVTVEDCGGEEEEEEEDHALFESYNWLSSLVSSNDCDGTTISEYDLGSYAYIHVDTPEGGALYFENGTYYCGDSPGFDCVALYGLSNPSSTWTCGEAGGEENTPGVLTGDYVWLENMANSWECGLNAPFAVTEYNTGYYSYIYIQAEENGLGQLYFEDGTYYCGDSEGFNCVSLYGLNGAATATSLWTCAGKSAVEAQVEALALQIQVYPNPSTGVFSVEIEAHDSEQQQIMIYDLQGRMIAEQTILDTQYGGIYDFDLSDFDSGVYLVTILTGYETRVEKLMIQR